MVDVLVIADGAATAFAGADAPVLDSLCAEGSVVRVATTPPGLPAGSETGIASLLGAPPQRRVGRGFVDAAAFGVEVPDGFTPWRADLLYRSGKRASVRQARDVCVHLGRGAHAVSGHRLVIVAREQPADQRLLGLHIRVWPVGAPPEGEVPVETLVVCARGAAAGVARLLGARVHVPPGATGDVDTDLRAKAAAALDAIAAGPERVVVHVGGPDEAAHRRDATAMIAAIERIDSELLAPLRDAIGELGGRLSICSDHGTDPATGRHLAAPVPGVIWGEGVVPEGPSRLVAEADARLIGPRQLLAGVLAA